ncbi:HlyD family efflux transporter periplasmic adaptor subunit [Rariglobus hedericola]|uniref:HlyD family efflux transporter periplasmic adaptor subunit n=1 Tax=Rariglobus hedericola TaxID=2597822 RepID=A0A556QQW2_9BACT|nr:HlyD family efflux transporter periplasmic adaptor subunit [Rariglobus hedericola]TSJ79021.1 HlyD family efflux transporter periplasmic adaptor subunit [Rariglobus hedericola]
MKHASFLRLSLASVLLAAGLHAADTVSALGRVLPKSGIIDLSGPPGDTVSEILVTEGDWVQPGQPLVRLSSTAGAVNRLKQAEADLTATRASTAKDIEIARARLATVATETKFAQGRYDRIAAARDSEFVSPDQIEDRTLGKQTAELKLAQTTQNLDLAINEAAKTVRAAEADVAAAKAQLAASEVRSPIKARILKIRARAGAPAGGRAELFKIGDTSGMIVVAEVYESDILKVKAGQKAVVTSSALPKKMTGTVIGVSNIVFRNNIESMDPNSTTQGRVVEATIRMDENEPLDRLVFLQVDVSISL